MNGEYSESDYPLKGLTEEIIGSAFKVHNTLGTGFVEKVYENALSEELRILGHAVDQQKRIIVEYRGKPVGNFMVDMIVDNLVIIETKAVQHFEKSFEDKLLNYLKSTKYKIGLIINFSDKVYVKRKINTSANKSA